MSLSPERDGRITASIFASAIGIGYDSRQKLWRQLTGREPRFEGNEATQWGNDNEHHAIDAYEIYTGNLVADFKKRRRSAARLRTNPERITPLALFQRWNSSAAP
jgi:hypothetical protein